MLHCPICLAKLQPTIGPTELLNDFRIGMSITNDFENELLPLLIAYWQWMAEGSKNKKKNPDVFGKYYKGLKYVQKKNEYFFRNVLTGDVRLSGAFKVDPGPQIRILRKRVVSE